MSEITKKRGGYRPGAGRKKTTAKTYGFNAPEDIRQILEKCENITEYIINAIREKAEREK